MTAFRDPQTPQIAPQTTALERDVLRLGNLPPLPNALSRLLEEFNLQLKIVDLHAAIPGSYWGNEEAGLIGDCVFARPDTPVHSVLHESCHAICMDDERRAKLHTDAGGEYAEEDAVCYLQILLADTIPEMGRARMWTDMDRWGYTFRLGSARAWFEHDAEDACTWLANRNLPAIDRRLEIFNADKTSAGDR